MKRNSFSFFCLLLEIALITNFSISRNVESVKLTKPQFEKCIPRKVSFPKIGSMTLKEKVGQMVQVKKHSLKTDADFTNYSIGSIYNDFSASSQEKLSAAYWADVIDDYQAKTRKSRLQIPLIWGEKAIHGYGSIYGSTIFPHHIGLGATRDQNLVKNISSTVSKELLATGVRWTFSPSLNLCKNPLLDPCFEEFGSDANLVSKMTIEIDGYQEIPKNESDPASKVLGSNLISSGAKFYLQNKLNKEDTLKEQLFLIEYFKPVIEAVGRGVMSLLLDSSDHFLNSDILKTILNYKGVILYDFENRNLSRGNYSDQVQEVINSGVDMVRVGKDYVKFVSTLLALVQSQKIPIKRVDDAVKRVLNMKNKLGLFQNACAYRSLLPYVGSPTHRNLARNAVRKSLVLLKNKLRASDQPLFPITLGSTRILVTGSHANDIGLQCGGWTVSKSGGSGNTTAGTTIFAGIEKVMKGKNGPVTPLLTQNPSGREQADYGIIVVGEKPYSRPSDNAGSLSLDPRSESIIRTVCFSTPCVLVLVSGRPLKIDHLLPRIDAVIAAWLPGSEGIGLADVLFGTTYDFEGKLPLPWFKDLRKIGSVNNTLYGYGYGLNKSAKKL